MPEMNEAQSIAALARKASETFTIGSTPAVILESSGGSTRVESLEYLLDKPLRIKSGPAMDDSASFVRYVNEHKSPETRIFASFNEEGVALKAIIDFQAKASPAWNLHKAMLDTQFSDELELWVEHEKKDLPQDGFAAHVEDRDLDFKNPNAADMLDVARSLEGTVTAKFKSSERLDNGDHTLSFERTTQAKAGQKGELEIPSRFTLSIPIFFGGAKRDVECRLRHRIDENTGRVTFKYEIINLKKIIEDTGKEVIALIEKETQIKPFMGSF